MILFEHGRSNIADEKYHYKGVEGMDSGERIELHIHSKEGGDSTLYAGEVIKQLDERGIPAVAITNTSSIFCFPEIETVLRYGKYRIRPIYGMEMPVLNRENTQYSISILVRNAEGLKNLYAQVSDNASTKEFPVYRWEEVLKYREGLLIGSGVENGIIYKMIKENASSETLKEALSVFDYVEVIPFEKYRLANLKIIEICEELKIPVVAVSDAHYIDPADRMAYQVISHWRKKEKSTEDYRFLSTEEMLRAFSYLSEEKAREIVIKNTHRIAGMCEAVPIIPKKKYFPKLENAEEILRNDCYESLKNRYTTEAGRKKAEERLEIELAALHKTEMESYVLLVKKLLNQCNLRSCDISLRGSAAGSIVLYLMGISEVDPLKYGLDAEFIFGNGNDREIDIDINVVESRHEEILQIPGTLPGVETAVRVGAFMTISHAMAEVLLEDYAYDTGHYIPENKANEMILKLEGNFECRKKHPGGMILFPSGCDYRSICPLSMTSDGTIIEYYENYFMSHSFIKLDLIKNDSQEMLLRLAQQTGMDLAEVPVNASEVLELFTPDENGEITKCEDLPEFHSEKTREIVKILKPSCFEDLVKIFTLSHGTGCWEENGQVLVEKKHFGSKELIGSRDDVFHYCLNLGIDRKTAFEISEAVRKGIASRGRNTKWSNWKKLLIQSGAEEWFIWSCEQIYYLFPKAHAVSYMIVNMKLGWFKVHYPEQFHKVMKQYQDESFF